jgi:outer membrane protein OmpA-like peptidoglycan-associated protein
LASIENPVLIRNIFYEFDSAVLLDSSKVALDSLVVLLNENPNVTIELASHCDFRGKDEYNEKLSQRRAESVVNYLQTHGIDSLRLSPKGYGEKRPKIVTKRIAATYEFLNEGDTLTEAFITALEDEEKQEICHSLNRRTEFKVLRTTYKLFDSPSKSVKKELTDSVQSAVDEKTVGDSGDELSGGTAGETGGTVGAKPEKPEKIEGEGKTEVAEKPSKPSRPERPQRPEKREAAANTQKKTSDIKKSDEPAKETPKIPEKVEKSEDEQEQL